MIFENIRYINVSFEKDYFYRRDKFWRNIIVRNIFTLSFISMTPQIVLNVFYDCRNPITLKCRNS